MKISAETMLFLATLGDKDAKKLISLTQGRSPKQGIFLTPFQFVARQVSPFFRGDGISLGFTSKD